MKKLILMLSMVLICTASAFAVIGDIGSWGDNGSGEDLIRFDSSGNILPNSAAQTIGTSAKHWDGVYIDSFMVAMCTKDTWSDVPTASTFSVYTVKMASGVIYLADYTRTDSHVTQPQCGRTLGASMTFNTSVAWIAGTVRLQGTDARGNDADETITISTGVTTVYTNNAFVYVSSVTARITSMQAGVHGTEIYLNIGSGPKLGLSNDVYRKIDVYGAREGTATVNPFNSVNEIYDTYDPITDPDGSTDYEVSYRVRYGR